MAEMDLAQHNRSASHTSMVICNGGSLDEQITLIKYSINIYGFHVSLSAAIAISY